MGTPLMIVLAITLLGLGYVVGPVMVDTFLRLRRTRTVRCPETGLVADVALDARRAALTAVPGPPTVRVRRCALWPEREDCAQRCVAPAGTS